MLKLLVPVDGSDQALAAVRHAVQIARKEDGASIHLLNVQAPVAGSAATFLGKKPIRLYYEEEGKKALEAACRFLDGEKVAYEPHVAAGNAAEAIAFYASENGFDQIIMTRRSGTLARLLGSVATDVLALAKTPVTFVPP
jgi:nucleotide-binding universal stress UspA family protein